MLVLSRKSGERINIGNDISIEIRRIAGNRVTIALHAPREVRILRGELQEAADAFQGESSQEVEEKEEVASICTIEHTVDAMILETLSSSAGA